MKGYVMDISVDEYIEELNKCMQMHPDYIEGHYAKANYVKRDVELFDAEDNKIHSSDSKAFIDCEAKMALKHKLVFKE